MLQISEVQNWLNYVGHAELIPLLDETIHHDHDQVKIIAVGLPEKVQPRVTSLGKEFSPVERGPVIV